MKIQFRCQCGALLECSVQRIGQSRTCPSCREGIIIPTPSIRAIREKIQPLPQVPPGGSIDSYEVMVDTISLWSESALIMCSLTSQQELWREYSKDAIRQLQCILVFTEEECRKEARKGSEIVDALASVAAGNTIAGIGTRKFQLEQYNRWRKTTESKLFHPFAQRVVNVIESLKTKRNLVDWNR